MSDRQFPIQSGYHSKNEPPFPIRIPWSVAERAYSVYSSRYGTSQSLERLAERGGFAPTEMDDFVPGWRDEVSEITALREALEWYEERVREVVNPKRSADYKEAAATEMTLDGGARARKALGKDPADG